MSCQPPKHYAVLRRWNDNPNDFEVFDYAASEEEARQIISRQPRKAEFRWEVGKYEMVSEVSE